MRLEVPFHKQTTPMNCGPTALLMVLEFLGHPVSLPQLERLCELQPGKALFTIQLACAAARLGHKAEFYSTQVEFNDQNLQLDFYKKNMSLVVDYKVILTEAHRLGVHVEQRKLGLGELLSHVTNNSLPIVLLDWNVALNKAGTYQGHFVPIIGFDEDVVYVHNPGLEAPAAEFEIPRAHFERARKAAGTDEDVVIVRRVA